MNRTVLFLISLIFVVFLAGATATMQQQNKGLLVADEPRSEQASPVLDARSQEYIHSGSRHKLILDADEKAVYAELLGRNAIIDEVDYGSFKLVMIDERALGGRDQLRAMSIPVRDDQDLITLNGYILDTTNPEATYRLLPQGLRKGDMAAAVERGASPRGGLYIVQFVGPVKDAWLKALRRTGAEVVTYLPSNAYVVRASGKAAARLPGFATRHSFAQFVGDYEPAYRLSPVLQSKQRNADENLIDITVQVIDGPDAEETIARLKAMSGEFAGASQVLNYHNLRLKVPATRLAEMAHFDSVFAIEERVEIKRHDEAQGQILAAFLSGNVPTGPGYLNWFVGKGFNSSQFTSFAVNVVDDATFLTGHPDLPTSRVAFQNNPSGQSGSEGGHGFLNANIIAGFNNGTGSAVEDAQGFNYGMGISPFARVGSTAIFGFSFPPAGSWESAAYNQGARISSNSWGFVGLFRYDTNAQAYDRFVRDAQSGTPGHQAMSIVFAAGNDGSGSGTVASPGTAKNIITVGGGENVRSGGTDGCGVDDSGANSANDIIGFSSRGPVNAFGGDNRVKPDIMGPATHVVAGVPQSNYGGFSVCNAFFPPGQTLYGWSSGTSHSCPAIAGGASLVYQDFLNQSLPAPSPAMVKAYLMNSATHMTGVGANDTLPSNNQGMGRMDLDRTFDSGRRMLIDQTQVLGTTGQTFTLNGVVGNPVGPFRVTLAWTDAPGPTTGAPFVNNLNLTVTVGGVTYRGNVFSGGNSVSGGVADGRNNVESVFLPAGVSGPFTITVTAANIAGDGVPGNGDLTDQDFALVVYNANDGVTPNPIDDAHVYVRQLYRDFLLKEPDQGGLDFWAGQITQCGSDQTCIDNQRVNVSRAFWESSEFQQQPRASGLPNPNPPPQYVNREFVRMCYVIYLQRHPDQAGWDFWTNNLNGNNDYNNMIRAFLTSFEYRARFGKI